MIRLTSHAKGTIAIPCIAVTGAARNNDSKKVILKNCAAFTNCINEINNTQIDNVHNSDVAMPIYNLTEYSDIYSNKSRVLWQ